MDKARCVFINFYTTLNQVLIIGAGHSKYIPFIRNMGNKNSDIDPVFSRQQQCCFHLIVDYKIRRCCIYIAIGAVDHIDMRIFSDIFLIGRGIAVRLHIAVIVNILEHLEIRLIGKNIILFLFVIIPELQKHQRQIPYSFSANHDTAILPVSKALLLIDILIRKIDSPGHSHLPVNDKDFSMIAVIHLHGKPRLDRIEYLRLNSEPSQRQIVILWQRCNTARIIVHDTYLHTLLHLIDQNIQNGIPHHTRSDNEVFHKNEAFSLFQFFHHCLEFCLTYRKVGCFRMIIDGKNCILPQIIGLLVCKRILCLQGFHNFCILP